MEIDVITVTRFNDAGLVQEYSAYWGPNNMRKIEVGGIGDGGQP